MVPSGQGSYVSGSRMTVSIPGSVLPTEEHFFSSEGSSYLVWVIPGDASVRP